MRKGNSLIEVALGALILSGLKAFGEYNYIKGASDQQKQDRQEFRQNCVDHYHDEDGEHFVF